MKPVVLLLAGGQSTRFWPLSDKNLIPMMGKPLIQWQIESLTKLGFKDIIVVGNQTISETLSRVRPLQGSDPMVRFLRQDPKLPGMAGAVLSAAKLYQTKYKGRPLYILNANDFYENELHESVLKAAASSKADSYIAAYRLKHYAPMGYLVVEGSRIKDIIEKPPPGKEPSDLVDIVAHLHTKPEEFLAVLSKTTSKADDIYEVAMAKLMKTKNFQAVPYQGKWQFLKYPWHLLGVMDFFLGRIEKTDIDKSAKISDKATIREPVIIKEGVMVLENAVIVGPAYIGPNTIVANNALVRQSVIGENCEIGYSTEVARSYVGSNCRLHTNYVGDSILEKNIDMGAGAVTANFRLDEQNIHSYVKGEKINTQRTKLGAIIGQNSKIGINASLMPGVKIRPKSAVMPGLVVRKDIT